MTVPKEIDYEFLIVAANLTIWFSRLQERSENVVEDVEKYSEKVIL